MLVAVEQEIFRLLLVLLE
jgi:hypothetical protein